VLAISDMGDGVVTELVRIHPIAPSRRRWSCQSRFAAILDHSGALTQRYGFAWPYAAERQMADCGP
jgi:hypothetical protein